MYKKEILTSKVHGIIHVTIFHLSNTIVAATLVLFVVN